MKINSVLWIGATAVCMTLVACGGGDDVSYTPPPTTPPVTMPVTTQLDTAAVLTIVQTKTSETSQPFQVNGSMIVITPMNDETGEPIVVDGT
jgi:hypothetical protein